MPSQIEFRSSHAYDIKTIREINQLCFPHPLDRWPFPTMEFQNHPERIQLALMYHPQADSVEIGGYIYYYLRRDSYLDPASGSKGRIGAIATHPDFQRQGIGSEMIKHAVTQLREARAYAVELETRRSNEPMQRFIKQHGFCQTDEKPGYYWDDEQTREDALVFTLSFLSV